MIRTFGIEASVFRGLCLFARVLKFTATVGVFTWAYLFFGGSLVLGFIGAVMFL